MTIRHAAAGIAQPVWHVVSGFTRTREWRQYRLLSRDSIRQLLNAATMSSGDPMILAIWVGALIATPLTISAIRLLVRYSGAPSFAKLEPLLLDHRMAFILGGMLAAALLAALTWEALFPNQTDQEALGALPVRPRTAAAARLTAALGMALGLFAALSVPPGVLFTLTALQWQGIGSVPFVAVAHVVALCGGPLFVFSALLIVRAVVAFLFGAAAADRMALALKVVTVIGLIEVFLYLPTVMPFLMRQMRGGEWAYLLPPVWFAWLYQWIAGSTNPLAAEYGVRAVGALLLALAGVTVVYLAPARLMARRALESHSRRRAGGLASLARATSRALRLRPAVASLFEFTLASYTRSPRHLFVTASYLGMAIAVGTLAALTAQLRGVLSPDPEQATLSLPLVLMFFVTLGYRAAFNIPTDLAANWPFRLLTPAVETAMAATRVTMMTLGIVPIAAFTMLLAAIAGWSWREVLSVGVFDVLAGALMTECTLYGWPKIPFACAHAPDADAVRSRWLLAAVLLNVFAFRGADLQLLAMGSLRGTIVYTAAMLSIIAFVRAAGRQEARRLTIDLDSPPDTSLQTLNLSEAVN